jgi:hypothetical protein
MGLTTLDELLQALFSALATVRRTMNYHVHQPGTVPWLQHRTAPASARAVMSL